MSRVPLAALSAALLFAGSIAGFHFTVAAGDAAVAVKPAPREQVKLAVARDCPDAVKRLWEEA